MNPIDFFMTPRFRSEPDKRLMDIFMEQVMSDKIMATAADKLIAASKSVKKDVRINLIKISLMCMVSQKVFSETLQSDRPFVYLALSSLADLDWTLTVELLIEKFNKENTDEKENG